MIFLAGSGLVQSLYTKSISSPLHAFGKGL
jgi:hypothetical protein